MQRWLILLMSTFRGKHLAVLTDLNTVLPHPANNASQSRLKSVATITYHYREATSRMMQNLSTHQTVGRSPTTAPSPDGACRAPHDNSWMGLEVLTIATICFAAPLLSCQIRLACPTMRLASCVTYDQYDFTASPSECEGSRSVV